MISSNQKINKMYMENVPWFLISSILTKLFGFILLPIYTQSFSKEELGSLYIYESLGRVVVIFISLYLDAAFLRYYYREKPKGKSELRVLFSTIFGLF